METPYKCPQRPTGSVFKDENEGRSDLREDGRCMYCGSFSANELMELLEKGDAQLIPTDKNYKVYVKTRDGSQHKFYFEHLSQEQMEQFIRLNNAQKLNVAEPGHFYVRPFFCQVKV